MLCDVTCSGSLKALEIGIISLPGLSWGCFSGVFFTLFSALLKGLLGIIQDYDVIYRIVMYL